jgi:hypothetical protein
MAYDFHTRDTQCFISFGVGGDGPDFGTGPYTILARVYPDTVTYGPTDQGTVLSKDFTNYEVLIYQGTVSGYAGGSGNQAGSLSLATTGAWSAVGNLRDTTPAPIVTYRRTTTAATAAGTNNSGTASGNGLVYLGLRAGGASTTAYDGRLAEIGMWGAVLTIEELDGFWQGFPARRIRPQSLVASVRLIRDLNEIRLGATVAMGTTAPTVIGHPRSYG